MKKPAEDPPKGSPAWMATFSDLMNLLLCFFVMLFSMSNIDEAKYNELVAAMSSSFSIFDAGATAIGEGILVSNGVSQLNELDQYINSTGKMADSEVDVQEVKDFDQSVNSMEEVLDKLKTAENEAMSEKYEEALKEDNIGKDVEIAFNADYIQLTMKGALLYESGSTELKPEACDILDKVGRILERYATGDVEIDGHTDNVPIVGSNYKNNEELSSARALAVFYYLLEHTSLKPAQLRHAGMGDRVPIADNSTEEGRAMNRRVEIRIYNKAE